MSLWLFGAIEEIGCEGQGCPGCRYQIYEDRDVCACEGIRVRRGYSIAIELWWLLNQPKKAKKLIELVDNMKKEDEVPFMDLPQIEEVVSLLSGLELALYEFTGNIHFRFDPQKIDWDLNKYSDLVDHWKNPDGTEVYTLVNSFTKAESIEYYLKAALRVGKPVEFD